MLLGVAGLGAQTAEYREAYWRVRVEAVGARRVVPIHRDSLVGSLDKPFMGHALFFHFLFFGDFNLEGIDKLKAFLKFKETQFAQAEDNRGVQIVILPRFAPVALW